MKYLLILILGFYSVPLAPVRTNKYYTAKASPLSQATNIKSLDKADLIFYGLKSENDGEEKDSLVVVTVSERAIRLSDADNNVIREYRVQSIDTVRSHRIYELLDKKGNAAYFLHHITFGRWNQFFLRTDSTVEIFSHGKGFLYQKKEGNPFKRN